jgi:hypothetical protein
VTTQRARVILSWSSGKDSAWALHVLRRQPDLEVVGLLTTFNEESDRVAMHSLRRELVEAQAAAAGLPPVPVLLPYPCTNEVYEERYMALNTTEATFIANQLMEQDIPACADRRDGNLSTGVWKPEYAPKVRIRQEDLPRAQAWLKGYENRRKAKEDDLD